MARKSEADDEEIKGVGGIARRALFAGVNMWLAAGVAGALTFAATFAFAPVLRMYDSYVMTTKANDLVGAWALAAPDCGTPLVIARSGGRLEMASAGAREPLDPLEKAEAGWLSAPSAGIEVRRVAERLEMRIANDPRSVTIYVRCAR